MPSKLISLTDATFAEQVLQSSGPVLVDFWAEWCAPCKQLLPIVDDIAEEYAGEARICKINADENKDTAQQFQVRGLPTMILFMDGKEKARLVGLVSKTRIAQVIDECLEA
ncbi:MULTISPECIES: thioredoxin [Xanthomonas]|uniref:Thioredoxin n=2 Tax=Xanthomonas TaxID=338 RepID=A0ABZ0JTI7_9XANT|nr:MULTISPECIES: thioredoxin [unclassified Xanthomonas]MXV09356.1 thioredoxin [Xanthomonas sp. LMG 9002]MBB5876127.1 thioredoxin 1 [Xanthomonas sp. 3498]MBO9874318.1 thioredoxin [Xanthomonas sp. D-93]WNH46691.1 thioredoxin [Xanthomonas sp. A6251]WOS42628.1 thioredoxin [Xanthomonas sp. DM-2023]